MRGGTPTTAASLTGVKRLNKIPTIERHVVEGGGVRRTHQRRAGGCPPAAQSRRPEPYAACAAPAPAGDPPAWHTAAARAAATTAAGGGALAAQQAQHCPRQAAGPPALWRACLAAPALCRGLSYAPLHGLRGAGALRTTPTPNVYVRKTERNTKGESANDSETATFERHSTQVHASL